MFVLEYKHMYIAPTEMMKNRTCQSYRWKQFAICEDIAPLKKILTGQKRPEDWRISELAI